jgi:hypothetical protein
VPLTDVAPAALRRETSVSVLWLSDTVFLRSIVVRLNTTPICWSLRKYGFSFSSGLEVCYAYSVSTFTSIRRDIAAATSSEIPIRFLQHISTGLPVGFFTHVELMGGYACFSTNVMFSVSVYYQAR